MTDFTYDESGKIVLDNIYNNTTPISYYTQLSALDYCIPERAKPHFEKVIAARRQQSGEEAVKIVDVGCSYGVNAALLKHGQSMSLLARHYREAAEQDIDRAALIAADQEFYAAPEGERTTIIGLDSSDNAIDYAVAAGILDQGVAADLETDDPDERQTELLGDSDLVISTGCYGYISEKTLDRLVAVNDGGKPWMAHFVLRMFDFADAAESLAEQGYVTRRVGAPVRQRRFADAGERAHVLDNLAARGVEPTGHEADGWYYAELHLSCPAKEAEHLFTRWERTESLPG